MEQFKRAQVIMLPSQSQSQLYDLGKGLKLGCNTTSNNPCNRHLYIISDDEVKDGDWCITYDLNDENPYLLHWTNKGTSGKAPFYTRKKIIATTDTSLKLHDNNGKNHCFGTQLSGNCKHILSQPSQQFIEKYIECYNKGEVITDILVEYENYALCCSKHVSSTYCAEDCKQYTEHSRLKINPKDNTITIKKVKNSWNREEVIALINKFTNEVTLNGQLYNKNKWINENL